MWYYVKSPLPYLQDQDYRESLIKSIRTVTQGEIDETMAPYGMLEVDIEQDRVPLLQGLPLVGEISAVRDRGMRSHG